MEFVKDLNDLLGDLPSKVQELDQNEEAIKSKLKNNQIVQHDCLKMIENVRNQRILFLVMPYGPILTPALGVSILNQKLLNEGFDVKTIYSNFI